MEERLQKILASAGVASRRKAEGLILEGRVSVNGRVVRELGTKADPANDHIKVDGRLIRNREQKVYYVLNKPKGVISTVSDPQGRPKVTDLVGARERIYPVGRLDYHSEGLLLLTNDGEFARLLTRPGEHIPKVYHVKVKGTVEPPKLERLRGGIRLVEGLRLRPSRIQALREGHNSWYEVTLAEGKNQQIRKMFEAVGHPVLKLRRVAIGFLTDRGLAVGQYRVLTPREVERFLSRAEKG